MECNVIMSILIDMRTNVAPDVQEILTDYGCIIDSRLGLHNVRDCAEEGLIILHLCGDENQVNELENKLNELDRVSINKMKIGFE